MVVLYVCGIIAAVAGIWFMLGYLDVIAKQLKRLADIEEQKLNNEQKQEEGN